MQAPHSKKTKRFYAFDSYRLHIGGELFKDTEPVSLPPKSSDVLLALVSRHGRVASKSELLREVWADTFVEESSLTYQISQLRKILGARPGGKPYIETATKRGYRFAGTVTESWEEESPLRSIESTERPHGAARALKLRLATAASLSAAALAVGIFVGARLFSPSAEQSVRRFEVDPQPPLRIALGIHPNIAFSPDGTRIVYASADEGRLWIHELESGISRPLEGSEGADDPFWSPGGDRIAYFVGPEIHVISARGGDARVAYRTPGSAAGVYIDTRLRGGAWSPDSKTIVFSEDGSLYETSAYGGDATLIVSPLETGDAKNQIRWPRFVPEAGDRVLLYTVGSRSDERRMVVHDLSNDRRTALGPGELPFYSASGHVLYQAGPSTYEVWALPFNTSSLQPTGKAFPVARKARLPMPSSDGTLVYLDTGTDARTYQLSVLDRAGAFITTIGPTHDGILHVDLSPDGRQAAIEARDQGNFDVWIHDTDRAVATRLTTHEADDVDPIWSPNGDRIAFSSTRSGARDVFAAPSDGSRKAELLLSSTQSIQQLTDWPRDGSLLLCSRLDASRTSQEIIYYRRDKHGSGYREVPFLKNARSAKLAPNGRYVAYESPRSGRYEVYLRSFPAGEDRLQVSPNGGAQVRWSEDGTELFYVDNDDLMVAPVSFEPKLKVGASRKLFSAAGLRHAAPATPASGVLTYDVAPGGERFVVRQPARGENPRLRIVQNWYWEFRRGEQN